MTRVVIVGGGLAGCLAALALARRADVELLLLEQGQSFGGNHTWSFFDSDLARDDRARVEELIDFEWSSHEVRFPNRSRIIPSGYNSITSATLDRAMRAALCADQFRLGAPVASVGANEVTLDGGERLLADCVIDARGGGPMDALDLGWQKFVGHIVDCPEEHGVARPVIMDARVPQHGGYRFLYILPLSRTRALIEDTYYSLDPDLDRLAIDDRLGQAARDLGGEAFEVVHRESGVLPVVMDGEFDACWPPDDPLPRLGVRGAFFHPTTSYSLPDAVASAALLGSQDDLRSATVAGLLRGRSERLWRERAYYRLLNRLLFRAAEPADAYRVFEHFYRLPQATIERFYAARLTLFDKVRILSGRPPVSIGRALRALAGDGR